MNENIDIWFNSVDRLTSVAIGAVFFYALIVLLVRLSGKRTTGQMNNFDWIVTVAVGSLAASGILLKDVSIADATVAILILMALQWFTTWAVRRSALLCRLVKAEPTLLVHKGRWREDMLSRERISKAEVYATLRQKGFTDPADANWVILETDGQMTVIPRQEKTLEEAGLMEDVLGWSHDTPEAKER